MPISENPLQNTAENADFGIFVRLDKLFIFHIIGTKINYDWSYKNVC